MAEIPAPEARVLFAITPGARDVVTAWRDADPSARHTATQLCSRLAAGGTRMALRGEPDYPGALLDLADPPRAVFLRGVIPSRTRAAAIVGSRAATPYGMTQARRLAGDLARLGFTIVSGLARGIDAAAHQGALEAGGASVAVLPGALDAVAPGSHTALAASLCAKGGLLSERARGGPGGPFAFLRRNRLIAALAGATVVVEAAERSGALSTAAVARKLGRPLLAVPGDVDRPTSRGVHGLLRSGARVCEAAGDVVAALGCTRDEATDASTVEQRLLRVLEGVPRGIETLARAADVPVEEALAGLLRLEWAGGAVSSAGQRWRRA